MNDFKKFADFFAVLNFGFFVPEEKQSLNTWQTHYKIIYKTKKKKKLKLNVNVSHLLLLLSFICLHFYAASDSILHSTFNFFLYLTIELPNKQYCKIFDLYAHGFHGKFSINICHIHKYKLPLMKWENTCIVFQLLKNRALLIFFYVYLEWE